MASRWFDDLCDDDFFTRPSRFRLLQTDPWGSLERLDHDLGRSDIFSDFASKAASLRHRVEQDRQSRESPQKKASSRRDSRVSDGIASPTPSSINSAFNFGETPPQPQGHVTFPASSCSNISECSEKSNDSITTEKSANHCSESEKLPGGGQACKAESTQSWVDRNTTGGIVGEGVLTETMKTESRPGSFQEYSKQKCSYVGTGQTPSNTFHSVISEERISQSSSSKSKIKHASPTVVNSAAGVGGKPFRAPPNRSLFYDELDSTLGAGLNRGIRRRTSPLDRLIGLVDQVAHHDRLFQSEMEHFINDQPKLSSQPATPNTRSDARTKTVEDLKKENEALKEENSRLEQVLQEVTAVNKRWQRYNTDRRMYVQKLLATIQDLQEQMNDRAESAIARPTSTATPARSDSGGVSASEVDGLRQQAQLLLLQIKSHKEDWQAEHQERCKIMQEKNELEGEVARLKRKLDVLQNEKQCSTCQEASANQQTHIASQDFSPRSSYETSFQVPFTAEDIHSDASTEIVDDQSSPACEDTFTSWRDSFSTNKTSASDSQSLYLGYPSAGLASVIGFSTMSRPESNQRLNITSEPRNAADQVNDSSLICPNCSRAFSPSRRICFLDHLEFCHSSEKIQGNPT